MRQTRETNVELSYNIGRGIRDGICESRGYWGVCQCASTPLPKLDPGKGKLALKKLQKEIPQDFGIPGWNLVGTPHNTFMKKECERHFKYK